MIGAAITIAARYAQFQREFPGATFDCRVKVTAGSDRATMLHALKRNLDASVNVQWTLYAVEGDSALCRGTPLGSSVP